MATMHEMKVGTETEPLLGKHFDTQVGVLYTFWVKTIFTNLEVFLYGLRVQLKLKNYSI